MRNIISYIRSLLLRYSHINWALADQAMLSALNFLIGLAFINFSTKTEYGIYVQLFALLMLASSVQRALIISPLNALVPKKPVLKQQEMIYGLFLLQSAISMILALVIYTIMETTSSYNWIGGLDNKIAFAFAMALIGIWGREYFRNLFFLKLDPKSTMVLDVLYGVALICGLAWLYNNNAFIASYVFGLMGIANIIVSIGVYYRSDIRPVTDRPVIGESMREAWVLGRWALPGIMVTWGHSRIYIYVSAAILGTDATAELSAARLFLVPLGLCFTAWVSVFLPRASRWYGEKDKGKMKDIAIRSIFSLSVLSIVYVAILLFCYPWLETRVLDPSYKGLLGIVAIWGGMFFILGIRTVGSQCMIAGAKFKELFYYGLIAFISSVPVTFVATWALGLPGPIIGILAAEIILAGLIWLKGWPLMWKDNV